ncbi:hypothetical protein ABFU27_15435 [Xanthomonas campestris pv. raphani]|uniref:hypothetical protein n=1 Tax=Xanthomonas campestris TaxID=339 RepID=UPI002B231410|nr:hypothetical protein [Xanthomonas campestris]MEA9859954.1 hypothetical protein [Xanthomonas campestris pv. raphani]MEA9940707.1 hypothetical protein [Xanthomonas campestris pv. raphani]
MRCHWNSRLILQALPASRMLAVMLFCLANSKQQTANSKQQTANSKQQTANSKQQTADSRQHAVAVHQRIHYPMQQRRTALHQAPQIKTW